MVQAIFKFILWITGAKVTVIGEENVQRIQAVLYVANHRSYFDHPLTYSRCPILHRLCCQEGNGTLSAALQLDAQSLLSLSRQRGYQAGSENDPQAADYVKIRHFRMYLPGRNQK